MSMRIISPEADDRLPSASSVSRCMSSMRYLARSRFDFAYEALHRFFFFYHRPTDARPCRSGRPSQRLEVVSEHAPVIPTEPITRYIQIRVLIGFTGVCQRSERISMQGVPVGRSHSLDVVAPRASRSSGCAGGRVSRRGCRRCGDIVRLAWLPGNPRGGPTTGDLTS